MPEKYDEQWMIQHGRVREPNDRFWRYGVSAGSFIASLASFQYLGTATLLKATLPAFLAGVGVNQLLMGYYGSCGCALKGQYYNSEQKQFVSFTNKEFAAKVKRDFWFCAGVGLAVWVVLTASFHTRYFRYNKVWGRIENPVLKNTTDKTR
jgi:hypothetical protein